MTKLKQRSWCVQIVGVLSAVVFLVLASGASPSKHASVLAQGRVDTCADFEAAAMRALEADGAASERYYAAMDSVENALRSAVRARHELNVLRDQIAHYETLEVFGVLVTDTIKTIKGTVQNLQAKLPAAISKDNAANKTLAAAMAEFVSAQEAYDLTRRASDQVSERLRACEASQMKPGSVTSPPQAPGAASRPASPAGRISFQLADVSPDQKAFYGGWTWSANGGQINLKDPSVGREEFTWTAVPQTFGAEGFQVVLHVQSTSNPNSRALAGIHIVPGDFTATPGQQIEALSENGQMAHKELAVSMRPPSNPSGNDLYIRIGADYGPGFIYHFRVIR
jgi:hypothetical protein